MSANPTAKVLGLYSPKANAECYAEFVRKNIADQDPENWSEESIAMFKQFGREAQLAPLTEEDKLRIEDDLDYNLGNAAFVEVLIRNVDDQFDAGHFAQRDPSKPEGMSQVAWNETYLSEDGESLIAGYPLPKVPAGPVLRVVFVIHFWNPELPLCSSYGELVCPAMTPLPERIWRLAPYETLD